MSQARSWLLIAAAADRYGADAMLVYVADHLRSSHVPVRVVLPQDGPLADDLRLAGLHGLPGLLVKFLEDGLGDPSGPLRSCARGRRVLAAPRISDDDRFDGEWRRVTRDSGYR